MRPKSVAQRVEGFALYRFPGVLPSLMLVMTKQTAVAFLIVSLAAVSTGFTADTPPTEDSIKQLLDVTQARTMVDTMNSQMQNMLKNSMQAATRGQKVTPQVQKEIEQIEQEMSSEMKDVLTWSKLESMYIRVYQKSFSAQEVDGLIAFYKTPTGQALLTKMPIVLQNTMNEVQQMIMPMVQRLQQKQQQIASELQSQKKDGG